MKNGLDATDQQSRPAKQETAHKSKYQVRRLKERRKRRKKKGNGRVWREDEIRLSSHQRDGMATALRTKKPGSEILAVPAWDTKLTGRYWYGCRQHGGGAGL